MRGTKLGIVVLTGAVGFLCAWAAFADEKPRPASKADAGRVPVAVARDRARLMHDVYSSTLDTMHRHYFRREGAVLPARAMDDVFAEVDRKTKIKSRWIAVNTPAMSLNHEPESEFEKKAAAALAEGKAEYEATEDGRYLRAAPIPLGAGCVGCHTKLGAPAGKGPRVAGLVISVPASDK